VIDAKPGQRAYRISPPTPSGRIFYRELEVVRLTPKQIIARTKMRQEYRFWRENGREVGTFIWAHIAFKLPAGDRYQEAGVDKDRSW
jgi:hypothetical protein